MTSTNYKIRLGLDLDGVVYNFVDEFRAYVSNERGVDPDSLAVVDKWEFYLDWGMTLEEYFATLETAAVGGHVFKSGQMYDGAAEAVAKVRDMGYEVVAVTARKLTDIVADHQVIYDNTSNWLTLNGIHFDELIVDNDKTTHGLNVLVDDSIGNIENFIVAGGMGIIFDRPWNQGSQYTRIMGWDDFPGKLAKFKADFDRTVQRNLRASA